MEGAGDGTSSSSEWLSSHGSVIFALTISRPNWGAPRAERARHGGSEKAVEGGKMGGGDWREIGGRLEGGRREM